MEPSTFDKNASCLEILADPLRKSMMSNIYEGKSMKRAVSLTDNSSMVEASIHGGT